MSRQGLPVCVCWGGRGGGKWRLGCGGGDRSLGSALPGDSTVVIVPNNTLLCTRDRCVLQTHGCQAELVPAGDFAASWDPRCTRALLPSPAGPSWGLVQVCVCPPGWSCSASRTLTLQHMLLPPSCRPPCAPSSPLPHHLGEVRWQAGGQLSGTSRTSEFLEFFTGRALVCIHLSLKAGG